MAQRKEHFHGKCVLGMSITQIIFGVFCITIQTVLLLKFGESIYSICAGIFFLIPGILGIFASQRRDCCTIIAFLVLAILSAIVALYGVFVYAGRLTFYSDSFNHEYYYFRGLSSSDNYFSAQKSIAIYAIMTIIAMAEAILAIVSSGYACHGLCCGDKQSRLIDEMEDNSCPNGQQQTVVVPMNQQDG